MRDLLYDMVSGKLRPKTRKTKTLLIAFSRYERTHPNLVSQAREIEILWTANWPPLYGFAGAVGLVFVYISAF